MNIFKRAAMVMCGFFLPAMFLIPQCGGGASLNCNIGVSPPYIGASGTRGAWWPIDQGGRSFATWWQQCRTRLHPIKYDPKVPDGHTRVGIIVNANNCTYDSPWINLASAPVWRNALLVVIAN